jgi:magnesium chelatase family protein
MSYASISSACIFGAVVYPVKIEVDIQPGLPQFQIIGLPDKQIEEAKERVRSALKNTGFGFSLGRITVNLSPSNIQKSGTGFDLGIALAILIAQNKLPSFPDNMWVIGELSLDGRVIAIQQLPAFLVAAELQSVLGCITARPNRIEWFTQCPVYYLDNLGQLVNEISKGNINQYLSLPDASEQIFLSKPTKINEYYIDQIIGQELPKRALQISLAGWHNLWLSGPPGSGKSMLANAAISLLPKLNRKEYLELIQIYSIAGQEVPPIQVRPFRAPHQQISLPSLLGGGNNGKPGELSLAHRGILFLDEYPEFKREVRESLREPLEIKGVRLNRRGLIFQYPADCLVLVAQNACPCGLKGVEGATCRCTAGDLARYERAVSEPILDRFDLFSFTTRGEKINIGKDFSPKLNGQMIAESVQQSISVQEKRQGSVKKNSSLSFLEMKQFGEFESNVFEAGVKYGQLLKLSLRAQHKALSVARTIADLEGARFVMLKHLQEALQYRKRPLEL